MNQDEFLRTLADNFVFNTEWSQFVCMQLGLQNEVFQKASRSDMPSQRRAHLRLYGKQDAYLLDCFFTSESSVRQLPSELANFKYICIVPESDLLRLKAELGPSIHLIAWESLLGYQQKDSLLQKLRIGFEQINQTRLAARKDDELDLSALQVFNSMRSQEVPRAFHSLVYLGRPLHSILKEDCRNANIDPDIVNPVISIDYSPIKPGKFFSGEPSDEPPCLGLSVDLEKIKQLPKYSQIRFAWIGWESKRLESPASEVEPTGFTLYFEARFSENSTGSDQESQCVRMVELLQSFLPESSRNTFGICESYLAHYGRRSFLAARLKLPALFPLSSDWKNQNQEAALQWTADKVLQILHAAASLSVAIDSEPSTRT